MKLVKIGCAILICTLFTIFIWPTKWERWQFSARNVRIEYRRNRFTDEVYSRRPNDGETEWRKIVAETDNSHEERKNFISGFALAKWVEGLPEKYVDRRFHLRHSTFLYATLTHYDWNSARDVELGPFFATVFTSHDTKYGLNETKLGQFWTLDIAKAACEDYLRKALRTVDGQTPSGD